MDGTVARPRILSNSHAADALFQTGVSRFFALLCGPEGALSPANQPLQAQTEGRGARDYRPEQSGRDTASVHSRSSCLVSTDGRQGDHKGRSPSDRVPASTDVEVERSSRAARNPQGGTDRCLRLEYPCPIFLSRDVWRSRLSP